MSREFPDIVDPWKAADGGRTFHGTMPLKRLERLGAMLAPVGDGQDEQLLARDDVQFTARFSHDEQGLVIVRLDVEAELPLICQRSLAPYREKIARRSLLVVIEDVAEQELIPDIYDPVLVEQRRLALQDIVEEELFLAIPQVPKNPEIAEIELSTDGEIRISSEAEKEQSHRPFAGLAELMKADVED